ncbi:DUF2948 family protein [Maricaulis sp.]|uniref:DUF2948 family protein n=1 Tax=Maricaulis sp. TaxID=1486257 RepID=UPI003A906D21
MKRAIAPLRLTALDATDLEAISAALQDAVAQLGDFEFSRQQRNFTIAFNRFRWEAGGRKQRVRCGVQFGNVVAARSHNIRQGADEAVVNLLSIRFEPGEAPSGVVVLVFSGGGELRLEVECLEVAMVDISAPWPATRRPEHGMDET